MAGCPRQSRTQFVLCWNAFKYIISLFAHTQGLTWIFCYCVSATINIPDLTVLREILQSKEWWSLWNIKMFSARKNVFLLVCCLMLNYVRGKGLLYLFFLFILRKGLFFARRFGVLEKYANKLQSAFSWPLPPSNFLFLYRNNKLRKRCVISELTSLFDRSSLIYMWLYQSYESCC